MLAPTGLDRLTGLFSRAAQTDRVHHAYLIEGERGAGKRTLANYAAALLLCDTHDACGHCPACNMLASGANPDFTRIGLADKSVITVDQVRTLIKEVYVRPFSGNRRVFVIEDAHLLNPAAQNALLKVIEEPPAYAVFLLLSENAGALLPTIRSRSFLLRIPPRNAEDLRKIVPDADETALFFSRGNPGIAQNLASDEHFHALRNELFRAAEALFSDDAFDVYSVCDFFEAHKEERDTVFSLFALLMRDLLLTKEGLFSLCVNGDSTDKLTALSQKISRKACIKLIQTVLNAQKELGKYGNYTIAVQAMLLQCREDING